MGGSQGGLVSMMLPLAMFAAIFYFMIIRPQKKKQKVHEEMLASISRGSTIITAGGFFGIVREILDDSYIIELDDGIKARILKSSVSMKKTDGGMDTKAKKKKLKKSETPAETTEEPVKEAEVVEAEVEVEETKDTTKEEA